MACKMRKNRRRHVNLKCNRAGLEANVKKIKGIQRDLELEYGKKGVDRNINNSINVHLKEK